LVEAQVSNLVSSCLNFIHIFLNKERIQLDNQEKCPQPEKAVWTYVSFSIIWSLGANLHDDCRQMFGEFVRGQIRPHFMEFPDGEVYEFGINSQLH